MAASIVVGTNSWVTLIEAEAYFSERIGVEAWDALTPDAKTRYLITAYRWLLFDPAFLATASATDEAVKYGQCEAALFLIENYEEYSKRAALIASGVIRFKYSKWEEDLGEITKPDVVINYFASVGLYGGGNGFGFVTSDDYEV